MKRMQILFKPPQFAEIKEPQNWVTLTLLWYSCCICNTGVINYKYSFPNLLPALTILAFSVSFCTSEYPNAKIARSTNFPVFNVYCSDNATTTHEITCSDGRWTGSFLPEMCPNVTGEPSQINTTISTGEYLFSLITDLRASFLHPSPHKQSKTLHGKLRHGQDPGYPQGLGAS